MQSDIHFAYIIHAGTDIMGTIIKSLGRPPAPSTGTIPASRRRSPLFYTYICCEKIFRVIYSIVFYR